MSPSVLIIAEGLILAGLLVWARLWVETYKTYKESWQPTWHVSLALAAIYIAALVLLVSIISATYSLTKGAEVPEDYAVRLAGFSVTITFLLLLLSASTSWLRAFRGDRESRPFWIKDNPRAALICTLAATAIGILTLIGWLLLGPIVQTDHPIALLSQPVT